MEESGIIRVMPETLANKIAAGEVVQRPASVVKELVENAIDAGARSITILLKAAGSDLISVIDDGSGMSPADAALSFQRHATSKITSIDDLEHLRTLGFRGEALASIGAVSRAELKTKRLHDALGTLVRVEGGALVAQEPCATANGTCIAVRNLFYNVPARRNFLKAPTTEYRHILETFQFLALSAPRLAFELVHDDAAQHRLVDWLDALVGRVGELFGEATAAALIPVEETTSYLTVRGVVGAARQARKSRGEQFLVVNDRFVRNRYLDHAVLSGYEEMLPEGAYPFYALFLDLDPRHVDVNVHPTKAEVKFDDERGVYGFIRAVVRKALAGAGLSPAFDAQAQSFASAGGPASHGASARLGAAADLSGGGFGAASPFSSAAPFGAAAHGDYAEASPAWAPGGGSAGDYRARPAAESASQLPLGDLTARLYAPGAPESGLVPSAAQPLTDAEADEAADDPLMWQLHYRFILTQIQSGLVVVDQNAAHERILYERALQSLQSGFGLSQQLLFPTTIDLSPSDHALLQELIPDLRSLGFDVDLFSGRSVVVRGVPMDVRNGEERSILEDLMHQFRQNRDALQLKAQDNLAKSIARRSAIQPGKKLSSKEMRALIDQLFLCAMPYACPFGRPTLIKIPVEELDRRFGHG